MYELIQRLNSLQNRYLVLVYFSSFKSRFKDPEAYGLCYSAMMI